MGSIIGLIATAAFMLGTAQAPVKFLFNFSKGLSKLMQRIRNEWKTHWSVVLNVEKMEKKQKHYLKLFFNDADRKQLLASERIY